MREIKFRAKRSDDGAWVYGDLTHIQKICSVEEKNKTGKSTMSVIRIAGYDVDDETIGQYTGLTDGNDTEIYEGDIVARYVLKSFFNYQIVFNNGAFCVKTPDDEFVPIMSIFLRSTIVKGNIYDNPELLKR